MKKIDMGKYLLLIGKDATEIFDYYNCEGFEKWHTEDSERMFYDTE